MPHDLKIPDYVIERIMAKRGRLHVFDRFDPSRTALVVIDMQNFFVAEVDTAKSICPNINRLAAAVRARGGTVAWNAAGEGRNVQTPDLKVQLGVAPLGCIGRAAPQQQRKRNRAQTAAAALRISQIAGSPRGGRCAPFAAAGGRPPRPPCRR